jgi:hypothetical protein
MVRLEKSKLKRVKGLLESSTMSKEIASTVKTAYKKLGKHFKLKGAFGTSQSKDVAEGATGSSFNCPNEDCGHFFSRPLRALTIQEDKKTNYYACPRCLSEITVEDDSILQTIDKVEDEAKRASEPEQVVTPEVPLGCRYHLGYLAERDSEASIPDECMICKDLMECMHKRLKNSN